MSPSPRPSPSMMAASRAAKAWGDCSAWMTVVCAIGVVLAGSIRGSEATVPLGGFSPSSTVVLSQTSWGITDCPSGWVVGGFCSSSASPGCSLNSVPSIGLFICYEYSGLTAGAAADHLSVGGSTQRDVIVNCPWGWVLTGLCTSNGNTQCRGSNGVPYFTAARCTRLASGLSMPGPANADWTNNQAQSHSWSTTGYSITTSSAASVTVCDPGYVAVSACSTGQSSTDCTYILPVAQGYYAQIRCVRLPTASPTHTPTSMPTAMPTTAPTAAPTTTPTMAPSANPTLDPTAQPTRVPSAAPTTAPTTPPTAAPTAEPTVGPSAGPTAIPTINPTAAPSTSPTSQPSFTPTAAPTRVPTQHHCTGGTHVCHTKTAICVAALGQGYTCDCRPGHIRVTTTRCVATVGPTAAPTAAPTEHPCNDDTHACDTKTTTCTAALGHSYTCECHAGHIRANTTRCQATTSPTAVPTISPTAVPTVYPSASPTASPTHGPTASPTTYPTHLPTVGPTATPTRKPTATPTALPTVVPTGGPTAIPTSTPTAVPTPPPTASPSAMPSVAPSATPTESPSDTPTSSPSDAPTTQPSSSPTHHRCIAGTHDCDATSAMCLPALPLNSNSYTCACLAGFEPIPGNVTACALTTPPTAMPTEVPTTASITRPSVVPTLAPTVAPSVPPTARPTAQPAAGSTTLMPTQTTAMPSGAPSMRPTAHHCAGDNHGCDLASTYCTPVLPLTVNLFVCRCLAGFEAIPGSASTCRRVTRTPTVTPTAAPSTTSAPTAPTRHPCDVGTHVCDPTTTVCAAALPLASNSYTCECRGGFEHIPGVTTTCRQITAQPSRSPTPEPTILPPSAHGPTVVVVRSPTASPTRSPTADLEGPTPPPTVAPSVDGVASENDVETSNEATGSNSGGSGNSGWLVPFLIALVIVIAVCLVFVAMVIRERRKRFVDSTPPHENPLYDPEGALRSSRLDELGAWQHEFEGLVPVAVRTSGLGSETTRAKGGGIIEDLSPMYDNSLDGSSPALAPDVATRRDSEDEASGRNKGVDELDSDKGDLLPEYPAPGDVLRISTRNVPRVSTLRLSQIDAFAVNESTI